MGLSIYVVKKIRRKKNTNIIIKLSLLYDFYNWNFLLAQSPYATFL
jgi:hypothetical protein